MFFLVAHALMYLYAASADYEADSKIQDTIANEFKERTILCIARTVGMRHCFALAYSHYADRLRTIIRYDKICVMDADTIAVSRRAFKLSYPVLTASIRNSVRLLIYFPCQMLYSVECANDLPSHSMIFFRLLITHRNNRRRHTHYLT
jgi:hypothetical protein